MNNFITVSYILSCCSVLFLANLQIQFLIFSDLILIFFQLQNSDIFLKIIFSLSRTGKCQFIDSIEFKANF